MAESTDTNNEALENSPNTGSEKSPDNSSIGTENITTKHETQNMETHAPHLHHAPRKKFWHYFYEFLMLFLAVFCGFLAENQREHYIEHKREKQYVRSFIEDLKSDTSNYNRQIRFRTISQNRADSLIILLLSPKRNTHVDSIYVCAERLGRGNLFLYNDRTIQQLKNSGGLRLIRNQGASDLIMQYDQLVRDMQQKELGREEIITRFREISSYILDASIFYAMSDTSSEMSIKIRRENSKLFSDNPETINRLCYWTNRFRIANRQVIVNQTDLKTSAIRIMEFLRVVYKLD